MLIMMMMMMIMMMMMVITMMSFEMKNCSLCNEQEFGTEW